MVLGKPGKPDLTEVGVEVAKRLREEVRIAVLKGGEIAKGEQSLRAVRYMRSQRDVVSSSTELYEVLTELQCNRIGELGMCLEVPIVS